MHAVETTPRPEPPAADRRWRGINWPLWSLGVLVVASAALDVWWLHRFRAGFPLDINESQYMGFGLALRDSLAHSGPVGAWHTWQAQGGFGPLLPVTSLPVFALLGRGVTSGFETQLLFFALLIVSSYGLGARLSSSRLGGLLVALLVAATPTVIDFTRSYEFPVTAAAILTACTFALLTSEAFTHRGWAIAWGLLLGLLPLARTMTIAFVPAQLIAAGWLIASRPGPRRPRLVNGSLALAGAVIVAGTWFATSWHQQLNYLTNFGYGSESANFSSSGSKLRVGYWTREVVNTVREDLYLPFAALLAVCVLLGIAALALRRRRRPRAGSLRPRLLDWSTSDVAIVALVVVEGYLAVTSSRNEGVGFRVPLLPAVLAIAVYIALRLPWRAMRLGLAVALASVALFNIAMKADAVGVVSGRTTAHVPGFGKVPVVDGLGWMQRYALGAGGPKYVRATKPLSDSERGWMPAYEELAGRALGLARRARVTPNVELTTDEPLLNAYNLSFAARLHFRSDLIANVLPGAPGPPALGAYQDVVRRAASTGVNVLMTVSGTGFSYFTASQGGAQGLFQAAAASQGFSCVGTVRLPDGRLAFISWRGASSAPPAPACAPRVERTQPAPAAAGVSPAVRLVAVFSAPMDQASLGRAIELVRTSDGRAVAGVVRAFGDSAAVFIPARPLPAHTRFSATVKTGARGATGAPLPKPYTWSFTTR